MENIRSLEFDFFFYKDSRTKDFSLNSTETMKYSYENRKKWLNLFIVYIKINSKCIIDPSIRAKILKPLDVFVLFCFRCRKHWL